MKTNVIYSIPCKNCNKKYVGMTSQNLKSRCAQRKSDAWLKKRKCALSEHVIDEFHHIDFDKVLVKQKKVFRNVSY